MRQGETKYDRVEELLRMATAAAASIGSDRLDYAGTDAAWPPVLDAGSVRRIGQPANPYEKR